MDISQQIDTVTGTPRPQKSTGGAGYSYETAQIGGGRNEDSATNSYTVTRDECNPMLLGVTTAVSIGAGGTDDTHLQRIVILANATAVTATIAGFPDQAGAAASVVLTGSTTVDTSYYFGGARNLQGPLTVTASVASKVLVFWRPR